MATYNAVNIKSGAVEPPKLITPGVTHEVYRIPAGGAVLASGDVINGPILPANTYLLDMRVGCDALGGTAAYSVGYTGQPAAFITAGGNQAVAGGIQAMNAIGSLGFTATTPTQVLLTMTGAAAAAGGIRIAVAYTNNP